MEYWKGQCNTACSLILWKYEALKFWCLIQGSNENITQIEPIILTVIVMRMGNEKLTTTASDFFISEFLNLLAVYFTKGNHNIRINTQLFKIKIPHQWGGQ